MSNSGARLTPETLLVGVAGPGATQVRQEAEGLHITDLLRLLVGGITDGLSAAGLPDAGGTTDQDRHLTLNKP